MDKGVFHIRFFALACCIAVVFSMSMLFAGCNRQETPTEPVVPEPTSPFQLDWHMKGSLINPNGDFAGSVPVTIQGILTIEDQEPDKGNLTITMLKTFRYRVNEPEGGYSLEHRKYDGLPYAIFYGYSYDRHNNAGMPSSFAIDPVKEYAIFQWDDGSGRFLVASQDPDVSSTEILDHFKDFIEIYGFDFT